MLGSVCQYLSCTGESKTVHYSRCIQRSVIVRNNHFPWLAGYTFTNTVHYAVVFHLCKSPVLTEAQLVFFQNHWVIVSKTVSSLSVLSTDLSQVQDFAICVFAELYEISWEKGSEDPVFNLLRPSEWLPSSIFSVPPVLRSFMNLLRRYSTSSPGLLTEMLQGQPWSLEEGCL